MFGSLKRLLGFDDEAPQQRVRPNQQAALQQPLTRPQQPRPQDRGWGLTNQAAKAMQFTPAFSKLIGDSNPVVGNGAWQDSPLLKGVKAAGVYDQPGRKLRVMENGDTGTLLHEGLHAAYTNPRNRSDFERAYTQTNDPQLQTYLNAHLGNYTNYKGDARNFKSLSPDIQNEVHSHTAEFYNTGRNRIPNQLKSYYGRYYNPEYGYNKQRALLARRTLDNALGYWGDD